MVDGVALEVALEAVVGAFKKTDLLLLPSSVVVAVAEALDWEVTALLVVGVGVAEDGVATDDVATDGVALLCPSLDDVAALVASPTEGVTYPAILPEKVGVSVT